MSTTTTPPAAPAVPAPADRYETFRALRTFSSLDGLRCLCILAVIWTHAFESPAALRFFPAARLGFLGVDLFFEISGFLIVTLLLRERRRSGGISLGKFYVRRILRIFPLYYGVIAVFAFYALVLRPHGSMSADLRHDLPALLGYLTNWFPAAGMLSISWSLSTEEQFYLVWPAAEKRFGASAVAIIGVAILGSQVIQFGLIDPQLQRWFGWNSGQPSMLRETTFTPICLGVLLAHLLDHPAGYRALDRSLCGHRWSAPVWLGSLVLLCNLLPGDIRGWGRPSVHLVMLLVLASSVIREDNGLAPFLTWRPVARIGVLSYGIYLLHLVAVVLVSKALGKAHLDHWTLRFPLSVLLSVGIAELSYRFYETPFLKMKGRFSTGA